jgi:hypothetical protein
MGVGFQICQPQNETHYLPHGKDGTQLFKVAYMRLEDNLDEAEKPGRVTTLNELGKLSLCFN